MKKYMKITAAESTSAEDRLKDLIDEVEDDFDFIIQGIERISRDDVNAAGQITTNLSETLQDVVSQIADKLQEVT